ncbi:MAG: hypothetical protein ACYC26_16825 [Phycisphaerales bacterium]
MTGLHTLNEVTYAHVRLLFDDIPAVGRGRIFRPGFGAIRAAAFDIKRINPFPRRKGFGPHPHLPGAIDLTFKDKCTLRPKEMVIGVITVPTIDVTEAETRYNRKLWMTE